MRSVGSSFRKEGASPGKPISLLSSQKHFFSLRKLLKPSAPQGQGPRCPFPARSSTNSKIALKCPEIFLSFAAQPLPPRANTGTNHPAGDALYSPSERSLPWGVLCSCQGFRCLFLSLLPARISKLGQTLSQGWSKPIPSGGRGWQRLQQQPDVVMASRLSSPPGSCCQV